MSRPDYPSWVGWFALNHPKEFQIWFQANKLDKAYLEYTSLPKETWESEIVNSTTHYAYCMMDDKELFSYNLSQIICGQRAGWNTTKFIIANNSYVVHKWGIVSRYILNDLRGYKKTKSRRAIYPLPKLDNMQEITLKDLREALDRPIDGEVIALVTAIQD